MSFAATLSETRPVAAYSPASSMPWSGIPATQQQVDTFEAHETVFFEGDEAEYIYEVLSGVVCCYSMLPDGRRQVLSFSFPGDLLGLAQSEFHRYSGETLSPVRIRRIPKAALLRIASERPELGRKLLQFATSTLAVMQDHFVMLGRKSAIEKVASFLLDLARRGQGEDAQSAQFNLPMTRTDIADYLGLTLETVSRSLTKLKIAGAIVLPQPQKVVVPDISRLESYAEPELAGE